MVHILQELLASILDKLRCLAVRIILCVLKIMCTLPEYLRYVFVHGFVLHCYVLQVEPVLLQRPRSRRAGAGRPPVSIGILRTGYSHPIHVSNSAAGVQPFTNPCVTQTSEPLLLAVWNTPYAMARQTMCCSSQSHSTGKQPVV